MRVLYVEDNQQLRESIASLLQCEGRQVVTCISAEEALDLDTQDPFDLVITDVTLPGMSGLEMSSQMLAAEPLRWIVLCSGHQVQDEVKALGPNVRALIKPFGVDDLDSVVSTAEAAVGSST